MKECEPLIAGLKRYVFGRWTCFGRRKNLRQRVTRRHLAIDKQTSLDKTQLQHYSSPFMRKLQQIRQRKSRATRLWEALYATLHPEFSGVFEVGRRNLTPG